MTRRLQRLAEVEAIDEGVVLVPFKVEFTSGTPAVLYGDGIASVANTAAGKTKLTLRDEVAVVYGGAAWPSTTSDSTDMYASVDVNDAEANGIVYVHTKTGSTDTVLPANSTLGGFLLVKKTTRKARG
jgi:hypothetical protein